MSEPNAGSDLASLTTKAVLDGDRFIVNGQKVWTSGAQHAAWCLCFVRTNTGGAEAQGHQRAHHRHADTGYRVPADRRADRAHVRGLQRGVLHRCRGAAREPARRAQRRLAALDGLARARAGDVVDQLRLRPRRRDRPPGGARPRDGFDARQRDLVASAYIDHQALQALGYSGFAKFAKGQAAPEHSILKLFGSEALQRALLLGAEESGPTASTSTTSDRRCGVTDRSSRNTCARSAPRFRAAPARSSATSSPSGSVRSPPLRVAVLVKQVPKFEAMELGPGGRTGARGARARAQPVLPSSREQGGGVGRGHRRYVDGVHPRAAARRRRVARGHRLGRGRRRADHRRRVRRLRHPRHGASPRPSSAKDRSISSSSAATRSTPTPGRSVPKSRSCSTFRSSPASSSSTSAKASCAWCARRTTVRASASCNCRRSSRRPSACANPPRSILRDAPRCPPTASA